jgi:hypothetical protein
VAYLEARNASHFKPVGFTRIANWIINDESASPNRIINLKKNRDHDGSFIRGVG